MEQQLLAAGFVVIFIALAVSVTIAVFYLLTLQNALKEVTPSNRQVEPSNVWLMFIPLFNIIYPFILYPKISDSIKTEFVSRGAPQPGDYARGIGLALPILGLCSIIPVLGVLAGLANLILFIIFWVKIHEFKEKLKVTTKANGLSGNSELLD